MAKFQRQFTLTVQGRSGKTYTFTDPLTVVFDVQKRLTGTAPNCGHFMLYNLSPLTRFDLEFDSAIDIDSAGNLVRRAFAFNGGYVTEGFQPIVLIGDIFKAFSYRDGPDIVTDFEIREGLMAMQQAQIQSSRAFPWTAQDQVERIVQTMTPYGLTLGAIGSLFNNYAPKRGVTWLGSSWDLLKRFAAAQGGGVYIDQAKVYVMSPLDVLVAPSAIPQLDATTGLIETPRRSGWTVTAQMIFEPRVVLGQQMKLKSRVSPSLNGTYAVWAVSHRGVISGAKDGGCVTGLEMMQSNSPFTQVPVQ